MSLFDEYRANCAAEIEQALDAMLPVCDGDPAKKLTEAMRYSLLGGGKRLRGTLTLAFCEACGGNRAAALPYAAGIEMMQAFSLIHDDLPCMDDDTLRRGKPTNHVVFGEAVAMLAGDALSIRSFRTVAENALCTPEQNALAVSLLARATAEHGMCGGQTMDLESEHKVLTAGLLKNLVMKKTGELFSASCELGCIAAGADERTRSAARTFALDTGLAFQIADDLLDLHATAEQLGKTPGKDVQAEKNTFPALLGEEEAKKKAEVLCEEAKKALAFFPESKAKDALSEYCDFVMSRTY